MTLTEPGSAESPEIHRRPDAANVASRSEKIPNRDGLRRTPERFEKALRFLTSGYQQDPEKLLNGAMFSVCYDQMVLVKDIEFYSLCEHHMLPFFGKCHVAYIPDKKVVGLSKIPRLVNMFARRLQIQERLTNQIASAIQQKIASAGRGRGRSRRATCAW